MCGHRGSPRRGAGAAILLILAVVTVTAPSCVPDLAVSLPEDVPDDFSVEYIFRTSKVSSKTRLEPAVGEDGEVRFVISGKTEKKKKGIFGPQDFKVTRSKADCLALYELVKRKFFSLSDKYENPGESGYGTSVLTITAGGHTKTVRLVEIGHKDVADIVLALNRLIKKPASEF